MGTKCWRQPSFKILHIWSISKKNNPPPPPPLWPKEGYSPTNAAHFSNSRDPVLDCHFLKYSLMYFLELLRVIFNCTILNMITKYHFYKKKVIFYIFTFLLPEICEAAIRPIFTL